MKTAYEKWRDAMHLARQARQVFGHGSDEHRRCQNLGTYWWGIWYEEHDCRVQAPPAERLEEYIKGAEKTMRYHKREKAREHLSSLTDHR